ncbi:MAG: cytochrome c [Paracoccaceae bacterium]|nr:cytochrome c [Paracoccaceae bacterium]
MSISRSLLFTAAFALAAGTALAGGHQGNPAVKARQSHMQLYQHNLGILGGMARGRVEYNADLAVGAAQNLATLTTLNQMSYWTPGTSTDDLGDETRALPAIWEEGGFAKAVEIGTAMAAAAQNLAAVAGDGQAAIGPALGAVGQSCNACHEAFQQPRN